MSKERTYPGVSRRLMPRDKHYGSLREQPIRGDVFVEGGSAISIERDWVGQGVRGNFEHPNIEGANPIGLHLARETLRTLPNLAASIHQEVAPRVTKIGATICSNCGERNSKVDPDLQLCMDRPACAKRAKEWQ